MFIQKKALYNIDVDVSFTEEHYEAGDFNLTAMREVKHNFRHWQAHSAL